LETYSRNKIKNGSQTQLNRKSKTRKEINKHLEPAIFLSFSLATSNEELSSPFILSFFHSQQTQRDGKTFSFEKQKMETTFLLLLPSQQYSPSVSRNWKAKAAFN